VVVPFEVGRVPWLNMLGQSVINVVQETGKDIVENIWTNKGEWTVGN